MNEIRERTFWSSSENSANNAWNVNLGNGNMNNNNKFNQNRVRAVAALQEITYDISFESILKPSMIAFGTKNRVANVSSSAFFTSLNSYNFGKRSAPEPTAQSKAYAFW